SVRGWHRRNIALGAAVGLAIGIAIGLAVGSHGANPSLPHFLIAAMFTTVGLGCGIIAPENFAGAQRDEESPPDDMEQSRQRLRRLTSVTADQPPSERSAEPRIEVRRKAPVASPTSGESKLSGWSILLMVLSVLVLMIPLFAFVQKQADEGRELREKQKQWQKEADKAILDGTAGRALRRLYGIKDDP
ncbi:MAG: hypothetical protein ACREHD_12030, partial [Pirellulales bacterium]